MKKWLKTNILWLALLALAFAFGFYLGKNKSAAEMEQPPAPVVTVSYYEPSVEPQPTVTPITTESTQEVEWETYIATAYCPCEKCCGKYAKNRPNGIVYTASGEIAEEGVTIAADWEVLPPGTVVEIDGIGTKIVHDKGSAIKGNRIDIYFESHQKALDFGVQDVQLKVLDKKESPSEEGRQN